MCELYHPIEDDNEKTDDRALNIPNVGYEVGLLILKTWLASSSTLESSLAVNSLILMLISLQGSRL